MLLSLGLTFLIAAAGPTLDQQVASVLPTSAEQKWLSAGWRLNLMRARDESQRSGKPMFLWIMNGHPLGCT